MSGKIVILPETLTHRIAAGEVVERPASIVKELVENALDAGATEIGVELEKGGCQSIRITDNGEGIDRQDVPLAFARYATSKIGVFEDIYQVRSFGFRGEALPSIASVCRMEMTTRRASSPAGTRVVVDAGKMEELSDAGCPVGTSIHVTRIFAPVPVRRKFLKSETTEQGSCLDAIVRLALVQPGVKLTVTAAGRLLLNIPAVKDPAERISLTLGRDFRSQLIPAAGQREGTRLSGFVSRPEFTRSNAAQMYLYVNGRFVKDYLLNHAVMTAYRRVIEARRYPAVVLGLEVPPGDVDVNVHPAKMEVRFRDPRAVYGLIAETVTAAIGPGGAPRPEGAPGPAGTAPEGYGVRVEEALKRYRIASGPGKLFFGASVAAREPAPLPPPPERPEGRAATAVVETAAPAGERPFAELDYLGQVAGTYLVFADGAGMVLVDQHAAHERILFERLKRQAAAETGRTPGQRLLIPEVVSLAPPRCRLPPGIGPDPGSGRIGGRALRRRLGRPEVRSCPPLPPGGAPADRRSAGGLRRGGPRPAGGRAAGEDPHQPCLPGGSQGEPHPELGRGDGALPRPRFPPPGRHLSARQAVGSRRLRLRAGEDVPAQVAGPAWTAPHPPRS